MKSATGNALLMNIIIVFLVVVLGLIVTSISYTKAYRVKNLMVNIIEQYNGNFGDIDNNIAGNYPRIINTIDHSLSDIGYRMNNNTTCPTVDGKKAIVTTNKYLYCIYEYKLDNSKGKYYKVIAYMYFDIPIVGDKINIPVYGETKIFY